MSIVYDNLTIDQIDGRVTKAVEIPGRRAQGSDCAHFVSLKSDVRSDAPSQYVSSTHRLEAA